MILTLRYTLFLQMARTRTTARKSTEGRAPCHQLAPCEPCPEPTKEERLRAKLAKVTAERNAVQQRLEKVTRERDQETLEAQKLTVAHHNCERMLVYMLNE
jgi:hypothetical protein